MKINTDPKLIENLLSRGVENIYPKREFLESKLKSGEQLTLYTGYDPTAPTLHIGHGITMLKLRQFQDLGHKVIMLIGDFTGMIGDPTDKTSARQKLTKKQVKENFKAYQKQAARVLNFKGSNKVEVKYNSKWLSKMDFADILELSSHFTAPRLFERDMFQERLKEGKTVYLHEFMYPVMQAYDSVAMNVDGEIGGNDQTFNMLAGRDLMKDLLNKEKFVLTGKLLADSSGKKMGKTEGNMIALSDSPEDMFGKVMRWTDEMIVPGFELCTKVPMTEVEEIKNAMSGGANPRDYKLQLAYKITKTFLGESEAEQGKAHFGAVIQSKDKPEEMLELDLAGKDIITVLVESKAVISTSQARRDIKGHGVKINDKITINHLEEVKSGDIIQKGKRFFVKIK
jgi:tyrosyl-tRNA synthetase